MPDVPTSCRPGWAETWRAFRTLASRAGIAKIAQQVPAHRATIYRMLRGDTRKPHQSMCAAIERLVKEHKP